MPERGPVGAQTVHLHGLAHDELRVFKGAARATGAEIGVRTGNPSRLPHIGTYSVPKPAGLYTKTAKGDAPHDIHGLVALKDNEQPPQGMPFVAGPARQGYRVLTRGAGGPTVHGDIDLQRVTKGGKPVPESTFRPALNAALDAHSTREYRPPADPSAGDKIQHGAHDAWEQRNNQSYAGGVNAGPLPGVINFPPRGAPEVDYTTGAYRERLTREGLGGTYTEASWQKGAERDKEKNEAVAKVTKPPLLAHPLTRASLVAGQRVR